MKIEMNVGGDYEMQHRIRVSHEEQYLHFSAATFSKTSDRTESVDPDHMFDEFNTYLNTLTQEHQNKLWDIYIRAHQILNNQSDTELLERQLQVVVRDLYALINLEEIRSWAVFHSNIRIPTNLLEKFEPNDQPKFKAGTYLRSQYIDLVALSVALRPMVPIWGQFIEIVEKITGSNFKEIAALRLLYQSKMFDQPSMRRLEVYIENTLESSKDSTDNAAAILRGLGTTMQPEWVRSLVLVRRLAISKISAQDDSSNIITNVFQYIGSTIKSQPKKFGKAYGSRIQDKNEAASSKHGPDEQTVSRMEMYKMKQKVSDGDIAALNVYVQDPYRAAVRIDPTVDLTLLDLCIASIEKEFSQQSILKHQSTLVQWTMSSVLPAPAGDSLNKKAILQAMATTQAVLWHWQFYDLAALVTASPLAMSGGFGYGLGNGRLPKESLDQLQAIYRHPQIGRGAKGQSVRATNTAAKAIDKFCTLITHYDWRLNCPQALANKTNRIENSRKMVVPGDIRHQLANLIIRIVAGPSSSK